MRPRLTDDDRAGIVAAYQAGEPVETIAERYGVSISYPTQLAKRRGADRHATVCPHCGGSLRPAVTLGDR